MWLLTKVHAKTFPIHAQQFLRVEGVECSQVRNLFGQLTKDQIATGHIIGVVGSDRLLKHLFQSFVDFLYEINVANAGTI